ncbi:MAG: TetR/AcrR family transcriptional regulator [Actinomycetota bacterium]
MNEDSCFRPIGIIPPDRTKGYKQVSSSLTGGGQSRGGHQLQTSEEPSPDRSPAVPVPGRDVVAETGGRLRRGDQTRARILEAAEEVFGLRGYHASSIVDITRRAGVGLGTFYVYFPSKIEIYRHLLRSRQEELFRTARAVTDGAGDYRDTLRASFGALLDWLGNHPFIPRLMREADFVDPALITELYAHPGEEFRKGLERLMDRGDIAKADAEVLAWCITGMTELAAMRFLVWQGKERMDPEHFETFLEILARALAVQPPPG